MPQGTIKKVVADRGFGFIRPNERGGDVFFHCSALPQRSDIDQLEEGTAVSYDVENVDGKTRAKNVTIS